MILWRRKRLHLVDILCVAPPKPELKQFQIEREQILKMNGQQGDFFAFLVIRTLIYSKSYFQEKVPMDNCLKYNLTRVKKS